jgi:hypothetical protein
MMHPSKSHFLCISTVGKFPINSNNGTGQVMFLQKVNHMFAESPLGICGTAAGALLSINNIVAIFHYMMNYIITNHILGNFVMSSVRQQRLHFFDGGVINIRG